MGSRSVVIVSLLGAAFFVSAGSAAQERTPSPPAESPAENPPSLTGEWAIVSVATATRNRDSGVERATDDMNVLIRGIARRRLRNSTPIHRRVVVSGTGATFRAQVGRYDLRWAPDNRPRAYRDPEGRELTARQSLQNGRLRQVFWSDEGTLTHTLMARDPDTLILTVRIAADRLPADVVYRVRYRRVGS